MWLGSGVVICIINIPLLSLVACGGAIWDEYSHSLGSHLPLWDFCWSRFTIRREYIFASRLRAFGVGRGGEKRAFGSVFREGVPGTPCLLGLSMLLHLCVKVKVILPMGSRAISYFVACFLLNQLGTAVGPKAVNMADRQKYISSYEDHGIHRDMFRSGTKTRSDELVQAI